jgi:hypothetical protein
LTHQHHLRKLRRVEPLYSNQRWHDTQVSDKEFVLRRLQSYIIDTLIQHVYTQEQGNDPYRAPVVRLAAATYHAYVPSDITSLPTDRYPIPNPPGESVETTFDGVPLLFPPQTNSFSPLHSTPQLPDGRRPSPGIAQDTTTPTLRSPPRIRRNLAQEWGFDSPAGTPTWSLPPTITTSPAQQQQPQPQSRDQESQDDELSFAADLFNKHMVRHLGQDLRRILDNVATGWSSSASLSPRDDLQESMRWKIDQMYVEVQERTHDQNKWTNVAREQLDRVYSTFRDFFVSPEEDQQALEQYNEHTRKRPRRPSMSMVTQPYYEDDDDDDDDTTNDIVQGGDSSSPWLTTSQVAHMFVNVFDLPMRHRERLIRAAQNLPRIRISMLYLIQQQSQQNNSRSVSDDIRQLLDAPGFVTAMDIANTLEAYHPQIRSS